MPFVVWPTVQRTKQSYDRWSLIRGIFTNKDYTSILKSSREIYVSIFLQFCLSSLTDSQNICRIDAHIREKCAHKKIRPLS